MRARLQPGLLVAAVVLCVLLLWRSTQHAGLQPSSSPTSSSPTSSPHAAPTRPKRSSAAAPEASPPLPLPDPRERGGYTFWSTDYHIAPIADLADLFRSLCAEEKLCMSVIEQSFSGACGRTFGGRTPTCAGDALRVIDKSNAFELCSGEVGPHAIRRAFYEAYRGPHSGLQHVDAFVCNHPPALCELYMPFNKSIVVFASVNLEFARENGPRWKEWLTSLRRIAADPRNVIAANNLYDAAYIRHFAGLEAQYIPSYCGYAATPATRYRPVQGRPVLLARNHHNPEHLYGALRSVAEAEEKRRAAPRGGHEPAAPGGLHERRLRFERTEDAYPRGFEYSQLAEHPAVVVVPYTKSVMSFFELYRMGVPLFAPSLELLVQWEREHAVMAERIYWARAPRPLARGPLPAASPAATQSANDAEAAGGAGGGAGRAHGRKPRSRSLSPNTRKSTRAMRHWLALSDIYAFPNVTHFDSWEHLLQLLRTTDLTAVSEAMGRANAEQLAELRRTWRRLFLRMFGGRPPGARAVPSSGFDEAMAALYGRDAVLGEQEPSCARETRPELGEWGGES